MGTAEVTPCQKLETDITQSSRLNPSVFQLKDTSLRLRKTLLDHVQIQYPQNQLTQSTPD